MADRLPMQLNHWARVAGALLSTQYAAMLEYRAEIALWALSGVLPLIMLGVWQGSGAAVAAGISSSSLNHYFLATFVVRQFTVVWLIYEFERDALEGKLSPLLLQPLHPLWRYVAAHLAEQATRIPFVAAMLVVIGLVAPDLLWWPAPSRLLLGLVAILAAFSLRFLLQTLVAMLCFWSERAAALDPLLLMTYLFLSGLVAPLDTYPPEVRRLAELTPFPSMVNFPARLLAGETVNVVGGFTVLALWCALLLPLCLVLWRAGVRRYSAMGA